MQKLLFNVIDTQIGPLLLAGTKSHLHLIGFLDGPRACSPDPAWSKSKTAFATAGLQLTEYFDGHRTTFDLPITLTGTPFQLEVWRALQSIPYGETRSYGSFANQLGRPRAARAVGSANGANPLSIIIPCHRLIAKGGGLIRYGGGLARKRALLELEQRCETSATLRE